MKETVEVFDEISKLLTIGRALARQHGPGDWVEAYLLDSDDVITPDIAAFIAAVDTSTMQRYCREGAANGEPLGILFGKSVWKVSTRRLLAFIEKTEGLPARLAAESRARQQRQQKAEYDANLQRSAPSSGDQADSAAMTAKEAQV